MASAFVIVVVAFVAPFLALGVVGNVGVILCIAFTPSLRTRANAIIVSLTLSCLIFLLVVVPVTLDSFWNSEWRAALWLCHASAYLTFAFIGITVYNTATLSLYRYFCVVHPLRLTLRSIPALSILIALAWLVPTMTQTTIVVSSIAKTEYVPEYSRCVIVKVGNYSSLYNLLVLGGFLPVLGLTLYSYAGIYCKVRKSAKRLRQIRSPKTAPLDVTRNEGTSTASRPDEVSQQAPSRVPTKGYRGGTREQAYLTKICVVVFLLFMISYGPIMTLTVIYSNSWFPADAYMICTVIYWLGSCLHPLVYACLQPQIRQSFLRLFRCCLKTPENLAGAPSTIQQQSSGGDRS